MKQLATALFAIFCLVALTGVAVAEEAPVENLDEAPTADTFDLFADEAPATDADCEPENALDFDGQEPTFMASNNCSVGCTSHSWCKGQARGTPCYLGSGQGWGSCNLYLGYQCSDGTGWDCVCYSPGPGPSGEIP